MLLECDMGSQMPFIELTLPGHCLIVCTLHKAFVALSNHS
jgi:hypothetical protein